jgi:hypothetical protein
MIVSNWYQTSRYNTWGIGGFVCGQFLYQREVVILIEGFVLSFGKSFQTADGLIPD